MTRLLSIDPGKNTGIALGEFGATGYRLLERWQVHGGLHGFKRWWRTERPGFDVLVVERFILDPNNRFTADLTPVHIEGLIVGAIDDGMPVTWQPRTDKAALTRYPADATTKAKRQRARFDFLKEHGLFAPGTDNDDSNDAITHALVYLKRIGHVPTLEQYWPQPPEPVAPVADAADLGPGF